MLQYFELSVFPALITLFYESDLKNVGKEKKCLILKNCTGYILLYLLFDIFYWLYVLCVSGGKN